MHYFPNLNVVYLKPSKTASCSVACGLGQAETENVITDIRSLEIYFVDKDRSYEGAAHLPWTKLSHDLKAKYKDVKKIITVRHPYDRVISEFKYQKKYLNIKNILYNRHRINEAIKTGLFWELTKGHHREPLSNYYVDGVYVIRYESLEDDWKKLQDFIGKKLPPLPKNNVSYQVNVPGSPKMDSLDEESKNIIYEKFKEDFKLFNYIP